MSDNKSAKSMYSRFAMRCWSFCGRGGRFRLGAEVPGVPLKLHGGGLELRVEGSMPSRRVPVDTWFAGFAVKLREPVWMAAERAWGCGLAGESNEPSAGTGGWCTLACSLWTAVEISDRSWAICASEKVADGIGVSSTLTDKGGGETLLGPLTSVGPAGDGIACSKA